MQEVSEKSAAKGALSFRARRGDGEVRPRAAGRRNPPSRRGTVGPAISLGRLRRRKENGGLGSTPLGEEKTRPLGAEKSLGRFAAKQRAALPRWNRALRAGVGSSLLAGITKKALAEASAFHGAVRQIRTAGCPPHGLAAELPRWNRALRAGVGSSLPAWITKRALAEASAFHGAVRQIRTADLVITNDVLCLLSYNSVGDQDGARTHDL